MFASYLNELLFKKSFSLLLAPPAWGKTRLLIELYKRFQRKLIFVSPLKALNLEFSRNEQITLGVFYLFSGKERHKFAQFVEGDSGVLVIASELMDDAFYLDICTLDERYLIVLDEFHLFYHWGAGFRPVLWESVLGLANSQLPILALSASFPLPLQRQWQRDFVRSFDYLFLIDLGNLSLKNQPDKVFWFYPSFRKLFIRRFLFEMKKQQGVFLYFCRYRKEVDFWVNYFRVRKITVLGCKGGEVLEFMDELKKKPRPACIFATSTLSHGVNLPPLSKIFIGYPVKDHSFWIQMVGRGGRQGEAFELYHQDVFASCWWSFFKSLCFDFFRFPL
jgi:superfamily II DNA or RNA helicase